MSLMAASEADDALSGALQRNRGTAIVCDGNGGKGRCGSDRERNGGEAARKHATGETREASGHRGGQVKQGATAMLAHWQGVAIQSHPAASRSAGR